MIFCSPDLKKAKSKLGGMSDLLTCIYKNHFDVKSIVFMIVGTEVMEVLKKVTLTKHMSNLLF